MVLPVSELKGVKVYNLSSGKTLPQWLAQAKSQRALRNNAEFRSRIELLQDLEFPMASRCVKQSSNGQYLMTSGVYPPQIKVFDLHELSMKFERHIDSEVIQMEILSEDFSKMAILRDDRTVEFHARYGCHHKLRVPKFGRDMMYQESNADLYVIGASSEAWRINLEQGRFLQGINTTLMEINACSLNPVHELISFVGTEGIVEMFDPRDRHRVAHLQTFVDNSHSHELTACQFDSDGLCFALGTSTGQVFQYDLRSKTPLFVKDHRYGLPIKAVRFHQGARKLISADAKIIKLWDRDTGNPWTSIQPPAYINGLATIGDSGILFAGAEQPRLHTFYLPELGPAPRWCAFLDSISEELEEEHGSTVYDDYKFVSRDEISRMGLEHLVGTKLLKAYMHGYFMDMKLYKKVKAISDPFEYDNYLKEKIEEKMEEKKEKRITLRKKLPRVNKELAEHLLKRPDTKKMIREAVAENDVKGAEKSIDNPLLDDRFQSMFSNPEFEIRKESEDYRRIHPSAVRHVKKKVRDERFDLIIDDEVESEMEDGILVGNHEDDSEEDERDVVERKTSMFQLKEGKDIPMSFDDEEDEDEEEVLTIEERIRLQEEFMKSKSKESDHMMNSSEDGLVIKKGKSHKSNNRSKSMNPFRKSKRRHHH